MHTALVVTVIPAILFVGGLVLAGIGRIFGSGR